MLEVSSDDKFLEGTIPKVELDNEHHILRACNNGKPETITHQHNGVSYYAIQVHNKIYIPDKAKLA